MKETKLCACGCGTPVPIKMGRNGLHKGWEQKYLIGHNRINKTGCVRANQYNFIYLEENPKGYYGGDYEHRIIAAVALGKRLPAKARVWHWDGDPTGTKNLVICENRALLSLLLQRKKALNECGIAHFRKCSKCGEYDNPENMRKSGRGFIHYQKNGCINYKVD